MKILTVVGARPQFIKAAVFSKAVKQNNKHQHTKIDELIVNTEQHFDSDMSDIFFNQLEIPTPKYSLDAGGKSHAEMSAKIMIGLEKIIILENPDALLVYGDTNSTMAAVLTASKLNLPIIHIEAGLRSKNLAMPEEVNRIIADRLGSYLFCPTKVAISNLIAEGYPNPIYGDNQKQKIFHSGDVMFDLYKIMEKSFLFNKSKFKTRGKALAILTIHRQESTSSPKLVKKLFSEINLLLNNGIHIVWPIHPRMRNILEKHNISLEHDSLNIIGPLGYLEMQGLVKNADFVITDSGGLQKESFFAKTPCITLRTETEWTETLEHGHNRLYLPDSETSLMEHINNILDQEISFSESYMPYGNGDACKKIIETLLNSFGKF